MLTKEICRKCWGKVWDEFDDKRWRGGMIYCPSEIAKDINGKYYTIIHHTEANIPHYCPYKLEQVVLEQC